MAEYEDPNDLYDVHGMQKQWKDDIIKRWGSLQSPFKSEINHLPLNEQIIETRKRIMKIFYDEGKFLVNKSGNILFLERVYEMIDSHDSGYDQFSKDINWWG